VLDKNHQTFSNEDFETNSLNMWVWMHGSPSLARNSFSCFWNWSSIFWGIVFQEAIKRFGVSRKNEFLAVLKAIMYYVWFKCTSA